MRADAQSIAHLWPNNRRSAINAAGGRGRSNPIGLRGTSCDMRQTDDAVGRSILLHTAAGNWSLEWSQKICAIKHRFKRSVSTKQVSLYTPRRRNKCLRRKTSIYVVTYCQVIWFQFRNTLYTVYAVSRFQPFASTLRFAVIRLFVDLRPGNILSAMRTHVWDISCQISFRSRH